VSRSLLAPALAIAFSLTQGACSDDDASSGAAPQQGAVVFGVTRQLVPGETVDRLRVTLRAGGLIARVEELTADGRDGATLAFPAEFALDGDEGTTVAATFEAFAAGDDEPVVTRMTVTRIPANRAALDRVELETCCASAGVGAPEEPIACDARTTCARGECVDPLRDPALLPDYVAGWGDGADVCRPPGDGAPALDVGQGVVDYAPTEDGDLAQVEAGPQGGHHFWVAVRADNILQKGTITTLRGHVPELDFDIEPFAAIFALEPSDQCGCELYGLRYQIDLSRPVTDLVGKTVELTAEMKDMSGATATGRRTFQLSDTIVSPEG
jgi:hypothetical protein